MFSSVLNKRNFDQRNQMCQELILRHKEYFESRLSQTILTHPELFPAITKVSRAIHYYLITYQDKIIDLMREEPKIIQELCGTAFFGSLEVKEDYVTPQRLHQLLLKKLLDPVAPMACILQIQAVFIYRVYDHLPYHTLAQKQYKNRLVDYIFNNDLFHPENRGRVDCFLEGKKSFHSSVPLGITRNRFFFGTDAKRFSSAGFGSI